MASAERRRGYLVVSGGGLGIMEAANLGAYLAERSDTEPSTTAPRPASIPRCSNGMLPETLLRRMRNPR